jgi:class 3 adenylate cyclase
MTPAGDTPGGERRRVTALFADVSGFTQLSETGDPETIAELMAAWFSLARNTITAHGGRTEKYIGDCVMALFGASETLEGAAQKAADAALDLRHQARALFAARGLGGKLDLHIGINSGVVLAGEIQGPDGSTDFRALGDAVNVGSRLEGAAAPGQILLGAETRFLLSREFRLVAMPALELKGKQEKVEAWLLEGRNKADLPAASETDSEQTGRDELPRRRFFSDLVGREEEIAHVEKLAGHVRGGEGQILMIEAPAGLGKSRLIAELRQRPTLASMGFLEARSRSDREAAPYHPFADMLANFTDACGEGIDDERARLASALETLADFDAEENLPYLASIAGLRDEADGLDDLGHEALERLTARSVRGFLRALAAERPLVVFFEDVHHADTSSLGLIEEIASDLLEHPFFLVLAARPGIERSTDRLRQSMGRADAPTFETISLTPLRREDSTQLVRNLLASDAIPPALSERIVARTDGNPFFMEEVVRWLADQGALELRDGTIEIRGSLEAVEIPASVQDVIRTRLDTLHENSRRLLRAAAVIGRRVSPAVLRHVAGANYSEEDLAELVHREFIYSQDSRGSASQRRLLFTPQQDFTFVHALVQETVYASILKSEAKVLHGSVAAAIEEVHAERLVDFLPMLALHYTRAENPTKAEEYLFAAGESASRTAASHEALHYFREAARLYLELYGNDGEPERLARLQTQIGLALQNCGQLSEAWPCFDRALLHLGVRAPSPTGAPDSALVRAACQSMYYLVLRRGRPAAKPASDNERWVLELILERARCLMPSNPRAFVETGIFGLARMVARDPRSLPRAMTLYGEGAILFAFAGMFGVSRRLIRAAGWASDQNNDSHAFALTFMRFACDYFDGKWRNLVDVEANLLDRALQRGEFWSVDTFRGLDAERLLFQGRRDEARVHIECIEELVDDYGYTFARKNQIYLRTLEALQRRDFAAARTHAAKRDELGETMPRILVTATLAQSEAVAGNLAATEQLLDELRELIRRAGELRPMHAGTVALAELQAAIALAGGGRNPGNRAAGPAAGSPAATGPAATALRKACRAANAALGKYGRTRPELRRLIGQAECLLGKPAAARRCWQRAIADAEDLRMPLEKARTLAAMYRGLPGPDAPWHEQAEGIFREYELDWDLAELQGQKQNAA